MDTERLPLYRTCVNWPKGDVATGLLPMLDSKRQISKSTFVAKVDPDDWRVVYRGLGFTRVFSVARSLALGYIGFYSGVLHGRRAYWIEHSRIEYVFWSPV